MVIVNTVIRKCMICAAWSICCSTFTSFNGLNLDIHRTGGDKMLACLHLAASTIWNKNQWGITWTPTFTFAGLVANRTLKSETKFRDKNLSRYDIYVCLYHIFMKILYFWTNSKHLVDNIKNFVYEKGSNYSYSLPTISLEVKIPTNIFSNTLCFSSTFLCKIYVYLLHHIFLSDSWVQNTKFFYIFYSIL